MTGQHHSAVVIDANIFIQSLYLWIAERFIRSGIG